MKGKESDKQPPWLLIKDRDDFARAEADFSVVDEMPDSVVPLRSKGEEAEESKLPGHAAALPASLKPQLATLIDGAPPESDDWLYELKFDGYRLLVRIDGDDVKLYTRNGHDWTAKLPHIAEAFGKLPAKCAWVDGEAVVLDENGVPNFQALQNAFDGDRTGNIIFYAFDLPFIGQRDLRDEPLHVRRALLAQLMETSHDDHLRFSEAFNATPASLVASACKMGMEGIIAKRLSSRYVSRRSDNWLKIKCAKRQEFVIVGYTAPQGSREGLGALLLAVHDEDGALRYAGKVGTGFDRAKLIALQKDLARIETHDKPVSGGQAKGVHWVKPERVAEVSFGEWTSDGHIRHSVFRGLRDDKPARQIKRERPATPRTKPAKLTHPERVIDPSAGITKLDLARYYGLVAPLLLPHLKDRPVSFLRAPGGLNAPFFFQKHLEAAMPGVKSLPAKLDPDHPPLLEVPTAEAIMSAVQMNVVEFHTWNAVKTAISKPDRMLFDLDPGEGVDWPAVQQGAQLMRTMLQEIGLEGWLKTSGGKGLHVVVPLRRQQDWDTIKAFSQRIVAHMAATLPQIFVAKSGPKNRVGKIFVDYLRNGFGATTVAAWSARARPGMGVSVPVAWDELADLKSSAHWTISNIHTRLDAGNTPWDGYAPQAVGRAMAAMAFDPAK
jgi:bifunctional non-homologous end joining protein LigD